MMYRNYSKLYKRGKLLKANKLRKNAIKLDGVSERYIQVMAVLFFVGIFLILIYGFKTIISWRVISWIYIILSISFSQIPTKLLPSVFNVRKELKVLLAICALAPFFTGFLLVLNYYITVNKTIRTVKITECHLSYSTNTIEVELDDVELNNHIEIRKFPLNKYDSAPDSAVYVIERGFLGLDIVRDSWLKTK